MINKRIYIDMDNTLVNYRGGAEKMNISPEEAKHTEGFFVSLEPMPGAIEAFNFLASNFDVYILTTSPWSNPMAACEKLMWVKNNLPAAYKRVIISHHKNLNVGDYLIDDMPKNGAAEFNGEWIQIGNEKFPTWTEIVNYFKETYNL